ncbi:MAG: hypothetical protein HOY69_42050 [Streptomyces sp.]|nr:hypothetical protein [Streptomyces sp.]
MPHQVAEGPLGGQGLGALRDACPGHRAARAAADRGIRSATAGRAAARPEARRRVVALAGRDGHRRDPRRARPGRRRRGRLRPHGPRVRVRVRVRVRRPVTAYAGGGWRNRTTGDIAIVQVNDLDYGNWAADVFLSYYKHT